MATFVNVNIQGCAAAVTLVPRVLKGLSGEVAAPGEAVDVLAEVQRELQAGG